MSLDVESLDNLLRQRPTIADNGFSRSVLSRVAAQQRQRRRLLLTVWSLTTIAVLAVFATQRETWLAHLQPLTSSWATHTGQLLTDASLQLRLPQLWHSTGEMVMAGLIALLLTTVFVYAWD